MKEDKTYIDVFIIAIIVLTITLFTINLIDGITVSQFGMVLVELLGFGFLMMMTGQLLVFSWYNREEK